MIPLPRISKSFDRDILNGYNGRWRQWYVDIADWMIAHPGGNLTQCSKDLGRHYNTICYITRSDTFRDYYAQRKLEHSEKLDEAIRDKLTGVATKSLDVILAKLEKQGDQIPMKFVTELATGTLDRLGYAPQTPAGVNVNISDSRDQRVQIAVNADSLREAQEAMRAAEAARAIDSRLVTRAAQRVIVPGDAARRDAGAGSVMADGPAPNILEGVVLDGEVE